MPVTAIIGAGVAGLASAIRLARAGHQVMVFEQAANPGGKMGELQLDGFRFDTGPSLFTWPELMAELLPPTLDDGMPAWERLDIIIRYFWDDGTLLDAYANPIAFANELELKLGEPVQVTLSYLEDCQRLFDLTRPVFLERYPASVSALLSWSTMRSLFKLPALKAWQSLHAYHTKVFRSAAAIQLFDRYATYNGSNPYHAPATLRVIAHLEHNSGAYFPRGGMYSLTRRLHAAARDAGVTFFFNHRVRKVHQQGNIIQGISAGDKYYKTDSVISAIDIRQFYPLLQDNAKNPEQDPGGLSSSALIFLWGIRGVHPSLRLHNVFFSRDYKAEFDHLFSRQDLADDLTIYLYLCARMNPADAPGGCENWFVMVNAPPDNGQDWEALKSRTRENLLKRLSHVLGISVGERIVSETIIGPRDLELHSGAFRGALYGNHSNGIFSAFRRHPNKIRQIRNLAFAGGTVHPGGGIPLCLLSARVAANNLIEP